MASSRSILFTLWLLVFSSASQIMIIGPILPPRTAAGTSKAGPSSTVATHPV